MKGEQSRKRRIAVGRVSADTKGPVGIFMESGGLWNGQHLTD